MTVTTIKTTVAEAWERLKGNYRHPPETNYRPCEWCNDDGLVNCILESEKADRLTRVGYFRVRKEKPDSYFTVTPCPYCEAGNRWRGNTNGSLAGAERWVKENVTTTADLVGMYEKAEHDGFDKTTVKAAFRRLGYPITKLAGRLVVEPPPKKPERLPDFDNVNTPVATNRPATSHTAPLKTI